MRKVGSAGLLVLAGILLLIGVLAGWAGNTVYDSNTFSGRATAILDSPAVRQEVARTLTVQLAHSGNQQAINFRPALQLAIESAIDTDTFRSIFRSAVRRIHAAVLSGQGGGSGLDLQDSATVLTSTLQLGNASAGNSSSSQSGLGGSLNGITNRLGQWGVWQLDNTISWIAIGTIVGALVAALGAVALARDRNRMVRRLGWVLLFDGVAIVAVLLIGQWWLRHLVRDSQLSRAVGDAIWHGTADLRTIGLWIAGYGLIIAAAATSGESYTPAVVARRVGGWIQRRRQSTRGTIALGLIALLAGLLLIQDPTGNLELIAMAAGLWLSYLGVTELLRVLRSATIGNIPGLRWRRLLLVGGTVAVLLVLVTTALTITTRRAANRADAAGKLTCNGAASLCGLRLDQVMFPGTHNAMSSSLYPGYLFGEQIETIQGQLDSGVRALLIDTHYAVPSTMRLPGSETPLMLTDRTAELNVPSDDAPDPALAERASRLAARAPRAADARRGIYLCHNYCELGAVPFTKDLSNLKNFLDSNPNEVVITIIQDATTPKDTAAAIEAAGLGNRVATLQKGQPLPTLGQLITTGRTLLVFAEQGLSGGPAWYHPAYQWFQETPFRYGSAADFSCRPNRGSASNPLLLVNHWVTPSTPSTAANVNNTKALEQRIETCIAQRALLPTIVAVDFVEKGNLVSTLRDINAAKVREVNKARNRALPPKASISVGPPPAAGKASPTPKTRPMPTVPPGTTITTLTGGNPDRFCAILPTAVREIVAWAQAILGAPPRDAGVTDLVYAPALARDLGEYADAAPIEVAERVRPLLARADAAIAALHNLGLNDAAVQRLADAATTALRAPGNPDGVTVANQLESTLTEQVPKARVDSTAVVFTAGQKDPATLLDLGYVPSTVAQAAGYGGCPDVIAQI